VQCTIRANAGGETNAIVNSTSCWQKLQAGRRPDSFALREKRPPWSSEVPQKGREAKLCFYLRRRIAYRDSWHELCNFPARTQRVDPEEPFLNEARTMSASQNPARSHDITGRQIAERCGRIRSSWSPIEKRQRQQEAQIRMRALWAVVAGRDH
jgi:hypothetical protein